MPITAKLSGEFYERFGDRVVNEMVDFFNRMQAKIDGVETRLNPRVDSKTSECLRRLKSPCTCRPGWIIAAWVVVTGMVLPLWFR